MKYILSLFNLILCALLFVSLGFARDNKIDGSNLNKSELRNFVTSFSGETIGDEFEIDLTNDEKPEFLIGDLCGNGGCQYHIFKNLGGGKYQYVGATFLQRGQFEVLKTMHNGFSDILGFSHAGGGLGSFTRYEFDGSKYVVKASLRDISYDFFGLLRPTIK